MKNISVDDLNKMLETLRGATPVTILASTIPDYVGGKKCPVANVRKTAVVNGMINFSYQNAVNNQREREGHDEYFEPEPRAWGVRLKDNNRLLPLVEHKGNRYLELKVQKSLGHGYFDPAGNKVARETVEPHIRRKVDGARQELDKVVILRDYKLANIKAIRVKGELYVVQHA